MSHERFWNAVIEMALKKPSGYLACYQRSKLLVQDKAGWISMVVGVYMEFEVLPLPVDFRGSLRNAEST